ncbi:aminotransferase class V-fold PLP-dependent enzyme [Crocinitomix catalasitica]|nr:aminotransferase class V-fold PLP-dependent enzyme [Crocinitomix catalasitica]
MIKKDPKTQRRDFLKKSALGIIGTGIGYSALSNPENFDWSFTSFNSFPEFKEGLGLDPNITYFNTGSLGPSPKAVLEKVISVSRELEKNPVGNNWGDLGKGAEVVRQQVADFINADVEEIVLTRNTTEGMNMLASGFELKEGDEILTSTDEHLGGLSGWIFLEKYHGAVIRKVEFPKRPDLGTDEILKLINAQMTDRTRICSFMDVSTITGMRMPMKQVSELCKERNIILVCDGAQSTGMLKVDVSAMGVDTFATSGHKWMLGPKETGFLYVRKEVQEQLTSMPLEAGFGTYTATMGTRNVANMLGLGEAIRIQNELGIDKIEAHNKKMGVLLKEKLSLMKGVELISPTEDALLSGITSVTLNVKTSEEVYEAMKEKNVVIKRLQENILRFSTHCFTSAEDVDLLVGELKLVLK